MKPLEVVPGSRIDKMHKLYGKTEGRVCRDCANLISYTFSNKYFKCKLYGDTGGPATDWRVRYPACGKFQELEPSKVE